MGNVLLGDKLVCPFHGATFNIQNGRLETGPAIDNIPAFEIKEEGGKSFVLVDKVIPKKTKGKLAKRDPSNK